MICTCTKERADDDPLRATCVFCNREGFQATCHDTEAPVRPSLDATVGVFVREGYQPLLDTLCRALQQAQDGKGKERHANGKPFLEQPIMVIGNLVGLGFHTGQAVKKTVEAHGMLNRGQHEAAHRELLGAINFLAAAAIRIEQLAAEAKGKG